jgi:hypothetical protein
MSILSESLLRRNPAGSRKSREAIEKELRTAPFKKNPAEHYDIFLSHRTDDAVIIYSLKNYLEHFGMTVFVDWVYAPELNRADVSPQTAKRLRIAMKQSNGLLYAISETSSNSKWMPTGLEYSDALHGRVAVVPICQYDSEADSYKGQEYLGLYPYITLGGIKGQNGKVFWVNESTSV